MDPSFFRSTVHCIILHWILYYRNFPTGTFSLYWIILHFRPLQWNIIIPWILTHFIFPHWIPLDYPHFFLPWTAFFFFF